MRLLEVVAQDLIGLNELGSVWQEPVGESLVQLGPRCLRERVVRRVTDEQVAEPERVVSGEVRPVWANEFLANERAQPRRYSRLLGGEGWTAPRWKTSPSIEPRSSTTRSSGSS